MFARAKPVLFLLLAAPFLTEVPTGSAPVLVFFSPIVFVLFTTIGYGIPALIIRELHVRNNLSLASVFVLGLAYGVWNEGLFARTIFHPFHAPIPQFATYGLLGSVRLPFLLVIGTFHALFAIVFPILMAHWLFPARAREPWVPKKFLWGGGLLGLAFGTAAFLTDPRSDGATGTPPQFLFMLVVWAGLGLLAWALRRWPAAAEGWRAGRLAWSGGLSFVAVVVVPTILVDQHVPVVAFGVVFALLLLALAWLMPRLAALPEPLRMSFVWGGEIALCLFGMLMSVLVLGDPVNAVVVLALLVGFAVLLRRALRDARVLA